MLGAGAGAGAEPQPADLRPRGRRAPSAGARVPGHLPVAVGSALDIGRAGVRRRRSTRRSVGGRRLPAHGRRDGSYALGGVEEPFQLQLWVLAVAGVGAPIPDAHAHLEETGGVGVAPRVVDDPRFHERGHHRQLAGQPAALRLARHPGRQLRLRRVFARIRAAAGRGRPGGGVGDGRAAARPTSSRRNTEPERVVARRRGRAAGARGAGLAMRRQAEGVGRSGRSAGGRCDYGHAHSGRVLRGSDRRGRSGLDRVRGAGRRRNRGGRGGRGSGRLPRVGEGEM